MFSKPLPLLILAALAVGTAAGFVTTQGLGGDARVPVTLGNPEQRTTGSLNQEAAARVTAFRDFPVLWLGAEFDGLPLTRADSTAVSVPGAGPDGGEVRGIALVLIYGDCEVEEPGQAIEDAPSCIPPVQIRISTPGTVPQPGEIPAAAQMSDVLEARGVMARDVALGTILWLDNGVTITVHCDSDIRDQVIAALRSANGSAMGFDDVGPGASLTPLSDVPLPNR